MTFAWIQIQVTILQIAMTAVILYSLVPKAH